MVKIIEKCKTVLKNCNLYVIISLGDSKDNVLLLICVILRCNMNWFERFMYRLKGCKVIKMDDEYWKAHPVDNNKKTTVSLEFRCL